MSTAAQQHHAHHGVEDHSSNSCYVPGEGWVRWAEIERQVNRAYSNWLQVRALAGKFHFNAEERRQAEIEDAVAAKRKRVDYAENAALYAANDSERNSKTPLASGCEPT